MTVDFFDSHGHINAPQFDADRDQVVERMKAAHLAGGMVIACEESEIDAVVALVRRYPGYLYGAWALHPEFEVSPERTEVSLERILHICSQPEMKAVGETGLDYHWCKGDLTWQKNRFRRHIEAAKILGKPVIVHAREAEDDALKILIEEKAGDVGFVLHCFAGSTECALKAADNGGMVSVTGVLTFKNAAALQETVRKMPLANLMIETDCPYMAPVPYRGKRNEPAYVVEVARKMAELKGLALEEVAAATTANARRFFKL